MCFRKHFVKQFYLWISECLSPPHWLFSRYVSKYKSFADVIIAKIPQKKSVRLLILKHKFFLKIISANIKVSIKNFWVILAAEAPRLLLYSNCPTVLLPNTENSIRKNIFNPIRSTLKIQEKEAWLCLPKMP